MAKKRMSLHLTPEEVSLIRVSSLGPSALARELGVTRHAVIRVRQGRTYMGGETTRKQTRPTALLFDENGDLLPVCFDVPLKRAELGQTLRERIARNLLPRPSGCIEWNGSHNPAGRPCMRLETKNTVVVARLVWIMNKGPIPKNWVVRHGPCNNGRCVNIEHLSIGTRTDNNKDRERDGTVPLGTAAWNSKITEDMVRRARAPNVNLRALSTELGVRYHTLYQARVGISWKHITDPPPVTASGRLEGVAALTAKLTVDDVRAIRASTESISELSRRYGVSRPAIRAVKSGESWRSVH